MTPVNFVMFRRSVFTSLRRLSSSVAAATSSVGSNVQPVLEITPRVVPMIRALQKKEQNPSLGLRVLVEEGGCYAFTIKINPETKQDESDYVFGSDDAKVLVDRDSMPLINGATLDHVDDMMTSRFEITNNPNSQSGCGCGNSFSPKMPAS